MKLIDFEYDGKKLSEFGCIPVYFNSAQDELDIGNNLNISDLKAPMSDERYSLGTTYDDVLRATIEVLKFDCEYTSFSMTEQEVNSLMRWLNRKVYKKFKPIYDTKEFKDVYYMATFNVDLLKNGNDIVGMTLELITNAPYGFIEPVSVMPKFKGNDSTTISSVSDEIGSVYADVTIKCLGAGDLILKNSLDKNSVVIKNCKAEEIITMYGKTKIIQSNMASHTTLPNDFNYNFLRIFSTPDEVKNVITCNMAAEATITYVPIRKVGLIV